jgi:hypothetical protein
MSNYGYRNRRDLFREMRSVTAESQAEEITLSPSRHEALQGWSGHEMTKEMKVRVPLTSPPAVVGRSLRLAIERCV